MNPDARRIVVLGGGFGGVYAALGLEDSDSRGSFVPPFQPGKTVSRLVEAQEDE
jgi:hypothetical protein